MDREGDPGRLEEDRPEELEDMAPEGADGEPPEERPEPKGPGVGEAFRSGS